MTAKKVTFRMFYIPVHKLSFTSKSKRAVTLYNILEENLIAFIVTLIKSE